MTKARVVRTGHGVGVDADAVQDQTRDRSLPFTRADFAASGQPITALRGDGYVRIMRSVWSRVDAVDADTRIRGALLLHPAGAIASHYSAARVHRLPVPEHFFEHVTVFRAKDRRYRPELKSHVTTRPRHVQQVRGIPVLDPVSTFIQLAGSLSLVDLVVLGDAIVRRFNIAPKRLLRLCRRSSDYYAGRAAAAAEYVRRGVDSPMETRVRMLIVLAGLPEPSTNVRLVNDDGSWRRRFDLCYPGIKLIVEYDGRQHAEDRSQWRRDLQRREEFDDEGYRILVVTAEGIYTEPQRTLERVRRQLVLRGWQRVPAIDDGWKEHFLPA
jgi:hypothetical protein